VLDALGDDKDVTGAQLGGVFLAAGFAQRDVELTKKNSSVCSWTCQTCSPAVCATLTS
jgi:hypothetical protein